MNEKKGDKNWICPICNLRALYNFLIIDGLFLEILSQCSNNQVIFNKNGLWSSTLSSLKPDDEENNIYFNYRKRSKVRIYLFLIC
jgi:hypothetical protein